ncbi:ATP-binding cassette subfamily B protein [Sedimentibacter acidaminivorans]|uniref:ATP-binding cassette subfamily B protein n=1 Tax=Sedimentibacter acidaminivorans TaxID=913099 RepID=A0ABS4GFT6_9FIRM|nr:ABC transporter ATP-binding protein [Sedimentibacter acidaminivorans]MBP1926546.1 ATP-binding cassette subfamily B protein [Sedimentibacter acidaminivorans]
MKGKNKLSYKILFSYADGLKKFLFISAVATVLRVFVNFITPQVIRITVDSVIGDKPMNFISPIMNLIDSIGGRQGLRENIWISAVAVLILAVITCICDYIGRVTIAKGSEGIIKNIRNGLYEHIQKLPYHWHVKNQTGDIIQRSTSDVEVVRNFISTQLAEMFRTIMLIIVSLTLMFSMNFKLTSIVLIFVPIIIIYSSIFYGILSRKFLVADEAEGDLFSAAQENLTGVRVVRAFGREKYEIERFSKKNRDFSDLWVKLGYQLGYYWGLGDLVTGFQVMTIICVGVIQASNGVITLGEFLVFVSYNSMLAWPVRSFGRILGEMSKTKVSVTRICEVLNEPVEDDEPDNISVDMNKDIEFKNVSFKYEGPVPVVSDISFKIKAGTTFAILGGTGSGKTTLMHLLNRLYDLPENSGTITIGGVDIRKIKRDYLRSNIGMVLQEPFLFSRTIKQNISIVNPDAEIDEIKHISEIAHVDEAIENFSKGYDTVVGERGVTLSGGQKQRVAIARMLLQQTPIMVFDDSLSAVDSETDSKIRSALKESRKNSTTILISHRITTLMQADMILVLDKGKVVDLGTHEDLINHSGIYKSIYDVQMNISDDSSLS